jgi:hypothetical protein
MTGEAQVLLILSLAIGGVTAYGRYLRHLRDMAMIEQGMDPRQPIAAGAAGSRLTGRSLESILITIAIGLALTVGMSFIGFGPWLLAGLIPMFIGLARLLALLLQGDLPKAKGDDKEANHGV